MSKYLHMTRNNSLDKITFVWEENKPNILSNKLDQAPKVWESYEERLQDPKLKQEIFDAMDKHALCFSKEWDGDEIIEWLDVHRNEIPSELIYESEESKVSFLVHKEKKVIPPDATFVNMIGPLWGVPYQLSKLWCAFQKEKINFWEIWTYITFTKCESWKIIVGAEQIEIPRPALLGIWYAYHKELTSKEFKEVLDKDESNKWDKQEIADVAEDIK